MRLRNRLFPVIGIALSIVAAPYLAGQLTLWFLSLTDPAVTWHLWSDYARVMRQAGYAAYAWRIRLAGGLGFGVPLLVILACVVTLIRAFRAHRALRPTPRFEPLTHVSAAFRHGVVLATGDDTRSVRTEGRSPTRADPSAFDSASMPHTHYALPACHLARTSRWRCHAFPPFPRRPAGLADNSVFYAGTR